MRLSPSINLPVRSPRLRTVRRRLAAAAFASSVLLAAATPVRACPGPFAETHTLAVKLPKEAFRQPVVARVRIAPQTDIGRRVEIDAVVTVALKGVEDRQRIRIKAGLTSCSRLMSYQYSNSGQREFYIAGAIGPDGIFRGEWRADGTVFEPPKRPNL